MTALFGKIRIKIRIYRIKFRSARPEYTRFQWCFKLVMLFISAIGFQLAGLKINDLEFKGLIYGLDYIFFMMFEGLFLALGLWRLLEVYWWAKNRVLK